MTRKASAIFSHPKLTMEYSQKYTLVQFFQQVDIDEVFRMTEWPPHVTLADTFAVDITDQLIADLETHLDTWPYTLTYVQNEGTLGTTDVWLLKNTPELQALHDRLVDILESMVPFSTTLNLHVAGSFHTSPSRRNLI